MGRTCSSGLALGGLELSPFSHFSQTGEITLRLIGLACNREERSSGPMKRKTNAECKAPTCGVKLAVVLRLCGSFGSLPVDNQ
jgi:hypothetical protein